MNIPLAKIGLEHIKSFSGKIELDLAPMTLFVGPNNSGKSTVIHALNILKESYSRDARSHIDIQEFLKTIITTGGMRERYGKLSEFVKNGENDVSKIIYSIKIPGMQGDVKVTAHIEKKSETEYCISEYIFSDLNNNKYLFSFHLENNKAYTKKDYYFRCNFSNLISKIKISDNLSISWWNNELVKKKTLQYKYTEELKIFYQKTVECVLKVYSIDEIIQLGKTYADIMLEYDLADSASISNGNKYIIKYFSFELLIEESILDKTNFLCLDLNVLNEGVDIYGIFYLAYANSLKSQLNSARYIIGIQRKFLEIAKINIHKHSEIKEIKSFNKKKLKYKILNNFAEDVYAFLKSNQTFKNVYETIDKDEIRERLEDINDMNAFFSINHVFENIISKDIYLNEVATDKLVEIVLNINQRKDNIFDAKSIYRNKNKLFLSIFDNFVDKIITDSDKHRRSKKQKAELIDKYFIETLNRLKYSVSRKIFLPKFNNFFIDFKINKNRSIETLRNIHLQILQFLGNSLYYELNDVFGNPIEDARYIEILGKEMGEFKELNEDSFNGDYPILNIIKLRLFSFLHESNLTELITNNSFDELKKFNIFEWDKLLLEERFNDIYESILEKVKLDDIELCLEKIKISDAEVIYESYISYIEYFILPSFVNIRKLFSQSINWLPANKTKFKRHIPLDSDSSEPIVKAILLQNDEYEKSRIIRTNRYLKALSIDGHLESEKNIELDIATLRFIQGDIISNIMDEGHGFSQLAIMCHYFDLSSRIDALNNQVLFIEEPEVSLHPSLQSKLADVFKIASKEDGIQLVIETHSEYLIRKLQYLTAKGELNKGDVAIYYFSDPKTCKDPKERVFRIDIEEDGSLSRPFGSGFYDETNNIIMDMMMLNFPDNKN